MLTKFTCTASHNISLGSPVEYDKKRSTRDNCFVKMSKNPKRFMGTAIFKANKNEPLDIYLITR